MSDPAGRREGKERSLPEQKMDKEFIIACDKGYQNAEKMGITPDLILGDFDSGERPADTDARILTFPTRKDDTDTMLAVKYAIREGFRDIHIACAFGGRLDHAFSNIQAGAFIASYGGVARLYGQSEICTVFGRKSICVDQPDSAANDEDSCVTYLTLPRRDGYSLSVFSLSDVCEGVTIRGTKYEVEDVTLLHNDPVGTSNVWTADTAKISLQKGILMVMMSRLLPGEHI